VAASKKRQTKGKNPGSEGFGLVATGSSGAWSIDLDETTSGEAKWFVQIEGPAVYLYFQIPSPATIDSLLQFLDRHPVPLDGEQTLESNGIDDSLRIGNFGRTAVTMIRDNEFPDRCFLVLGPSGESCVRLALSGEELRMFTEALRQVREDLEAEGLG
jgi:hypothetical protein